MKSILMLLLSAFILLVARSVIAAEMPELAKKYGCSNCHKIERKFVGPGWQEVSEKYKDDTSAASRLSAKIVKGGGGVWGPIPMPENPRMSDPEVAELVNFILGLAR